MKIMKKKLYLIIVLLISVCGKALSAEESLDDTRNTNRVIINQAFDSVMCQMNDLITENASCLNVYADSYIGKVYPSYPPHWGVSFTTCASFFDTTEFNSLVQTFIAGLKESHEVSVSCPDIPTYIPLPTFALATRIGGIVLPFDIGLFGLSTFKVIDDWNIQNINFDVELLSLGVDIRYCIVNSAKWPKISVGAGYSFTRGAENGSLICETSGVTCDVEIEGEVQTLIDGTSKAMCSTDITNYTNTWFLQVQTSKKFKCFIPFGGYRVVTNYYSGKYNWEYSIDYYHEDVPGGVYSVDSNSSQGDRTLSKNGFSVYNQLFLGCGIQAKGFTFNLCAQWNINTNYISASMNIGYKM